MAGAGGGCCGGDVLNVIYNEIDPFAVKWLGELVSRGHIAQGSIHSESVEDIEPESLAGVTQFHTFAGIGVWSYALRLAGWPDDRPVWTGSCPCQPFSVAGRSKGADDARHLWPAWFTLIEQCRPSTIFGEQVISEDGRLWFDAVSADLEELGYTVAAADLCAAGVGAPHIRQRLFWVAHTEDNRLARVKDTAEQKGRSRVAYGGPDVGLAHTTAQGQQGSAGRRSDGTGRIRGEPAENGGSGWVAHAKREGSQGHRAQCGLGEGSRAFQTGRGGPYDGRSKRQNGDCQQPVRASGVASDGSGAVRGFWSDAEWVYCRDGVQRPFEPGTLPLVDGTPARVGRLRGYGNAIVAPLAAMFIETVMELL